MGSQMFSDVPMIFSGCSQMFSGYLKDTAGGSSGPGGSSVSCKSDLDFVGLMGIVSLVDLVI